MLEKTLESPLDCKEIKPVHPKGNRSWIFIRGTDAETEAPILWPPDAKNWLTGKDPDAVKDWRREKGTTEDEMAGWHHRLYGHEFEQAPGVGDGQGSLACCRPWGCKESDMTERPNWRVSLKIIVFYERCESHFHLYIAHHSIKTSVLFSRMRLELTTECPEDLLTYVTLPWKWHRFKTFLAKAEEKSKRCNNKGIYKAGLV